jgi:hypothetical protein
VAAAFSGLSLLLNCLLQALSAFMHRGCCNLRATPAAQLLCAGGDMLSTLSPTAAAVAAAAAGPICCLALWLLHS